MAANKNFFAGEVKGLGKSLQTSRLTEMPSLNPVGVSGVPEIHCDNRAFFAVVVGQIRRFIAECHQYE
jgi:hypothetical protein